MRPDAAINAFLKLYVEDRENDRQRELADYVSLWPEHATLITEEFLRLGVRKARRPSLPDGHADAKIE